MRAKVFFERTGLTLLLMLFVLAFSFGQNNRSITEKYADHQFEVDVKIYESIIPGDYLLLAYNPNMPNLTYFASPRFGVEWYALKSYVIPSNNIFMRAKCNEEYVVVVTDLKTGKVVSTMCATPACSPILTSPGIQTTPLEY